MAQRSEIFIQLISVLFWLLETPPTPDTRGINNEEKNVLVKRGENPRRKEIDVVRPQIFLRLLDLFCVCFSQ